MRSVVVGLLLASIVGCSSDALKGLEPGTGPSVSDAALLSLSQNGPTWSFYKKSSTPLVRTSGTHPGTHALVRFNVRAATQLDAAGKVRAGASFPDSSVIVKELFSNGVLLESTVMMKLRGSASAGFDGWIWAEFTPTGGTRYATANRGAACSSCHSQGIDYTRVNDALP